jgi:indole-3-acetate monooxygenase
MSRTNAPDAPGDPADSARAAAAAGSADSAAGSADAIRRLTPLLELVRARVPWSEQHRQPHPEVMAALARAGLLRLLAPRAYGGAELDLADFLDVVEAVSAVDGSAGWTLMTTNEEVEIASAFLPPATMAELLARQPPPVVAGSGVPAGVARAVEGGWELEGRWRFVTGSPVADELILCGLVDGPERPRRLCYALVPRAEADVLDTWHVEGLRGTGSHDVAVRRRFVPAARAAAVSPRQRALPDIAFYRLPAGLRFPFPKVAVAAGIARAAIGAFRILAEAKTPTMSRRTLAQRPDAAVAMAEAEALRGAGWAWARQLLAEVWACAAGGRRVPDELHARARLACSYSVRSSARAVEALCVAAGSTANFADQPLSRLLRDVRAVPQHFMVAPYHMDTAGRMLLGQPSDDPMF